MGVEAIEFPAEGAAAADARAGPIAARASRASRAAVVIAHGSSGPDSRGPAYAQALLEVRRSPASKSICGGRAA